MVYEIKKIFKNILHTKQSYGNTILKNRSGFFIFEGPKGGKKDV